MNDAIKELRDGRAGAIGVWAAAEIERLRAAVVTADRRYETRTPTPEAYEVACKALWDHRASEDALRAALRRAATNVEGAAFHVAEGDLRKSLYSSARAARSDSQITTYSARESLGPLGRITLTGDQAAQLVDFCGGYLDCELEIGYFAAGKDIETGEDMPAGLYVWCADYPDEGREFVPGEAVETLKGTG